MVRRREKGDGGNVCAHEFVAQFAQIDCLDVTGPDRIEVVGSEKRFGCRPVRRFVALGLTGELVNAGRHQAREVVVPEQRDANVDAVAVERPNA